jgi:hypothetical protein
MKAGALVGEKSSFLFFYFKSITQNTPTHFGEGKNKLL